MKNANLQVLFWSVFGLGLGEELWLSFIPRYLVALGASGIGVGIFTSVRDLLDGLYQYPGGWASDRFGRKRALMGFTAAALVGYAMYAAAWHWVVVLVGVVFVMGWKAGAFPTTFAVIGDSLPSDRRTMAFSIQSILVRLPRVLGAPLGGLLLAGAGAVSGVKTALVVSMCLGVLVLFVQHRAFTEGSGGKPVASATAERLPNPLRSLLRVECFVRFGEALAASFIILYVTDVQGHSAAVYGFLYGLQQAVNLILYVPSARLARWWGSRPMIAATFLFFAVFPLAVRLSTGLTGLVVAFLLGGLKEVGEPTRKAFIVNQCHPEHRGRTVGVYYTIRNLVIVPAGTLGGLLWTVSPGLPLVAGFAVAMIGVAVYLWSEESSR